MTDALSNDLALSLHNDHQARRHFTPSNQVLAKAICTQVDINGDRHQLLCIDLRKERNLLQILDLLLNLVALPREFRLGLL